MKKALFTCLGLAILAVSCKKSDPPVVVPSKFMTFTSGIVWNYETVDNIAVTTTPYTLTSTSSDSTINSKVYHIFEYTDVNGTSHQYYNNTNNDYFQYTELSTQLPPLELKYLNDNTAAGGTWSQAFSALQQGVTITANIQSTIESKGTSLTVNGITYNNVIKVKTEILNPTTDNPLVVIDPITQSIHSYFAPKYGLIKREFQLHVSGSVLGNSSDLINTNTTTNLLSSTVQ